MSIFETYLQIGFHHILDWEAYDHMLFLLALCAVYQLKQWRNILVLVTAFTIGHSISLALATTEVIDMNTQFQIGETTFALIQVVEFLIPLSILTTALLNVFRTNLEISPKAMRIQYLIALFFGLIHGMGFSSLLRSMLMGEESIFYPLLAFNVGIELGQLAIVAGIVLLSFIVVNLLRAPQREWNLFISGAAAGVSWLLLRGAIFW
ncbi:MAG: HupE/UreJ family protein [Bacteroidota bacterium]